MRITKLDSLRGIFSLMVAMYHFDKAFLPDSIYNQFFIRESVSFVDFFFVLSGFIIATKYEGIQSNQDFYTYLKKRLIRLYPLLLYTTTVYLCVQLAANFLFPAMIASKESLLTLLIAYIDTMTFQNSTQIFNSLYTSNVGNMGMNFPSWSISAEMIIYIFFGWIVLISSKNKKRRNWIFGIILLTAVGFSIYKQRFYFTDDFGYIRGIISFMLGYFVWYISSKTKKWDARLEWLFPILLIVVFYYLNKYSGSQKEMLALISTPLLFALSILIINKSDGLISRFLSIKPLQFLGKLSYSIYLNHILIITIVPHFMFKIVGVNKSPTQQIGVLFLSFTVLIVYSYITYLFIEKRIGERLTSIYIKTT